MREKWAGFLLMCAVVPLALVGYLVIWYVFLIGKAERGRAGVRALDHFVNATVFNGYAWESVSSHAWRMRDEKRWAKWVIKITNFLQKDHCERTNRREQPLLDFALSKGMDKQTIK